MKKGIPWFTAILENTYVNLIISIGLITIGIEELYKDEVLKIQVHWKHGISFYGILMLIQTVFKITKGVYKLYNLKRKAN